MVQILLRDDDTPAIHNEKIKLGADVMKNLGLLLFASGFIKPYIEGGVSKDPVIVTFFIIASVALYILSIRTLNELEPEVEQ